MSWLKSMGTRARLLFGRGAAESRMEEEMRFHLEMEAERLVREEGLDAVEARRRAGATFGGQDKYREEMREGRGLAWIPGLRLDLKLGARMLSKHPVLTFASVLALSVAVALAGSWFEFMTDIVRPRLPLPEAERIVQLRNRDLSIADRDFSGEPRSLHDFETWREELRSIEDLSAASAVEFSVTTEDGRFETLQGMRVTPSLFRLARVQPLLGRTLTDADDRPGAPPVVVLSYSAWQRLYDGDRAALGQTVRLGAEHATVIGVMPERFGFPVNEEIWVPLRERAVNYARREGPTISMVGRLAPGYSLEQARAELATLGRRAAAAYPDTHEHLRPELVRFARGGWERAAAAALNVPFLLFLIVVSANVATLLFARTATRESELALRSALGASRRRLIVQLIAESLVLTSIAAVLGLVAAAFGLGWGMDLFWEVQQTTPPFWFDAALSGTTILYVGALAVLAATIIGGLPAVRATRRQLRHQLSQPGSGGSGMRFGTVATAVIVVQVALCVAFLPVAIMRGDSLIRDLQSTDFPAEAYLTGRLVHQLERAGDSEAEATAGQGRQARTAALFDEVHRRLAADPSVVAATRLSRLPGFNHPVERIAAEGDTTSLLEARSMAVDPDFFDVVNASIVAGRGFQPVDATSEAGVAIVDRAWAEAAFRGRNAVGQRIRYPNRDGERGERWYEVVGVVDGMDRANGPGEDVGVYHPLRPGEQTAVQFYLRTAAAPDALVPQVHQLVQAVDPSLAVADLMPLRTVWQPVQRANAFFVLALAVIATIILLFALIGIYALMSFTVAQRAREIGIRAALGANPRSIIAAIFSRALLQIGLGVVLGAALVSLTAASDPDGLRLVGGVAAAMVVMGLIGCITPAVRALRVQPIEALRAE